MCLRRIRAQLIHSRQLTRRVEAIKKRGSTGGGEPPNLRLTVLGSHRQNSIVRYRFIIENVRAVAGYGDLRVSSA